MENKFFQKWIAKTAQTLRLFKYHVWGPMNQQPKLSAVACVYTRSSDLLPIFFYMLHLW